MLKGPIDRRREHACMEFGGCAFSTARAVLGQYQLQSTSIRCKVPEVPLFAAFEHRRNIWPDAITGDKKTESYSVEDRRQPKALDPHK